MSAQYWIMSQKRLKSRQPCLSIGDVDEFGPSAFVFVLVPDL